MGKSTLANVFLGESPDCENCTFPICAGQDSCTKNTNYAAGNWLLDGAPFTIVDTPGFGDSDNDDNDLIGKYCLKTSSSKGRILKIGDFKTSQFLLSNKEAISQLSLAH